MGWLKAKSCKNLPHSEGGVVWVHEGEGIPSSWGASVTEGGGEVVLNK